MRKSKAAQLAIRPLSGLWADNGLQPGSSPSVQCETIGKAPGHHFRTSQARQTTRQCGSINEPGSDGFCLTAVWTITNFEAGSTKDDLASDTEQREPALLSGKDP